MVATDRFPPHHGVQDEDFVADWRVPGQKEVGREASQLFGCPSSVTQNLSTVELADLDAQVKRDTAQSATQPLRFGACPCGPKKQHPNFS